MKSKKGMMKIYIVVIMDKSGGFMSFVFKSKKSAIGLLDAYKDISDVVTKLIESEI